MEFGGSLGHKGEFVTCEFSLPRDIFKSTWFLPSFDMFFGHFDQMYSVVNGLCQKVINFVARNCFQLFRVRFRFCMILSDFCSCCTKASDVTKASKTLWQCARPLQHVTCQRWRTLHFPAESWTCPTVHLIEGPDSGDQPHHRWLSSHFWSFVQLLKTRIGTLCRA